MFGNKMNSTTRMIIPPAGAFVLGGMMVLGLWLFCERRMISEKVTRLMADATDMMENKFKDNSSCSCDCENKNTNTEEDKKEV